MNQGKESILQVDLKAPPEVQEILIALLPELGFYAFEEKPDLLEAFILEHTFSSDSLKSLLEEQLNGIASLEAVALIPPKDWNEEWEKNFQPVKVGDFCLIRPPFKSMEPEVKYDIQVNPKMAFGTGHHATTRMMVELISGSVIEGKEVLDMGCGTGVLAILAKMMGAHKVTAIDIDPWSFENCKENMDLNEISLDKVLLGDAGVISGGPFGVIFANINRNILLEDGQTYVNHLAQDGELIISGFMDFDEPKIIDYFNGLGLHVNHRKQSGEWIALSLSKSNPRL